MTETATPQLPIDRRVINWLFSEDTGESSMSICAHMLGLEYDMAPPVDCSDFGRCLRLLDLVPEWKARVPEMATYGPAWAGLTSAWSNIERRYRVELGLLNETRKNLPRTYQTIKLAIAAGYRNDTRYECGFDADGYLSWAKRIDQVDEDDE